MHVWKRAHLRTRKSFTLDAQPGIGRIDSLEVPAMFKFAGKREKVEGRRGLKESLAYMTYEMEISIKSDGVVKCHF